MKFLRVFLRSSAGEIELDTKDHRAPFALLDGARGLGLPERSVDSTPIPAGSGSVLRSQRFDESEVVLPIAVRDSDATAVSLRTRELEKVLVPSSDEAVELVIEAPMLGTTRRRKVYYLEGLEGAVGGADSHITWRHSSVKFTALDPMWYGEVREIIQRVDPGRKPFLTERPKLKPGAQVHKESRVPTSSDAGSDGDVWYVGQVGRPNDVVEATNLAKNPKFQNLGEQLGGLGGGQQWGGVIQPGASAQLSVSDGWLEVAPSTSSDPAAYIVDTRYFDETKWQDKTFTVSATLRLDAAQTGSVVAEARKLNVGYVSGSSVYNYNIGMSSQAPNQPGEYRISVTATIPADAKAWFVRARSGSSVTPTYWTDVQIEEGSTATPFFYGDTPDGQTANEPHYRFREDGTSEKYLPATEFKPTDKYVHNGTEWEHVGLEKRAPFFPIILSSSTVQGAYKIEIQGDGNAWPTWLVDGPGEDLLIENIDTNERIFITGTFDERVTINTHPTVADITSETFQDGELWDRVSTDTELFPLRPGLNRIKITMVNSRPNSMVKIGYSETWLAGW